MLDWAGACSHEIERELSPYTMWLFSALMVAPDASEKAGLGCIPDASKIGGTGACPLNI